MTEKILIINHPEKPTTYYQLEGWLVTIGSAEGNNLVLPGEGIAPRHTRLEEKEGRWMIIDMDSPGGTFVDYNPLLPGIAEEWLAGQQLKIGSYAIELADGPIPVPAPAPPVVAPEPVPTEPAAPPVIHLGLSPALSAARPGEAVEFILEIDNQTDEQPELRLRTDGIPTTWVSMQSGTIRLPPRQRVRVPLMIIPPRDSTATTGQHPFEIVAESPRLGRIATARGSISISPFSQSSVAFASLPLHHGRENAIAIQNLGNAPAMYEIVAADASGELVFSMPQRSVALEAGQHQSVPITAAAKKRPFLLSSKVVPMEVRVQNDNDSIVAAGRVLIPPVLSALLLVVLAIPIVLLGLFIGRLYLCREGYEGVTNSYYNAICGTGPAQTAGEPVNEPAPSPTVEALEATPEAGMAPTSTFTSATPAPIVGGVVCEGALPTRLTVGDAAQVVNLEVSINVRSSPRVETDPNNRICELRVGRLVDITGGPECDGEGQLWYFIRSRDAVQCTLGGEPAIAEGWVVEESGGTYFLEPVE